MTNNDDRMAYLLALPAERIMAMAVQVLRFAANEDDECQKIITKLDRFAVGSPPSISAEETAVLHSTRKFRAQRALDIRVLAMMLEEMAKGTWAKQRGGAQ